MASTDGTASGGSKGLPASADKAIAKAAATLPEAKRSNAHRYLVKCWKVVTNRRACAMKVGEDGLSLKEQKQLLDALGIKPELIESKPRQFGFPSPKRAKQPAKAAS